MPRVPRAVVGTAEAERLWKRCYGYDAPVLQLDAIAKAVAMERDRCVRAAARVCAHYDFPTEGPDVAEQVARLARGVCDWLKAAILKGEPVDELPDVRL